METIDVQSEISQWANQPFKPKLTWFFYREDGELFTADENYAYELMRAPANGKKRFDLIGVSDMSEYKRILDENKDANASVKAKTASLRVELRRYEDTLIKFKYEELREDDDEMVIKIKARIEGIEKQIQQLESDIHGSANEVHQKALAIELERAKLNKRLPRSNEKVELNGAKIGGSDNIKM